MNEKNQEKFSVPILFIATIFWGSTFACTKELTYFLSPTSIVSLRFSLATVLLFIFFSKRILKSIPTLKNSKDLLIKVLLLGVINFVAIFFQTLGLSKISISNLSFITSIAILLVPFIEFFFRKKNVPRNIKISVFIAFAGIYLLSYGVSLPQGFIWGDIITGLCAIAYSFYIVLVDTITKRLSAVTMMFFVFLITTIFALPFSILFDESFIKSLRVFVSFHNSLEFSINLGWLVVFGTMIPYILMGVGQRYVNPQVASMIYILEPIFAILIAIVFFNQSPLIVKYFGGGLILIAQIFALKKTNPFGLRV